MNQVDFLPERIRLGRARKARRVRQAWVVALAAAILVTIGIVRHGSINKAQAELAMVQRASQNVRTQLAVRQELERQQADLLVKKRIDDQLGSRVTPTELLGELQRMMPTGLTLTSLAMEGVEVRPGGAAKSGRSSKGVNRVALAITGLAPNDVDVANFIGQLAVSPFFEEVTMGYSRNTDFRGHPVREFQVSCYVVK
jgi:Tfp pilus assembly protein PilN